MRVSRPSGQGDRRGALGVIAGAGAGAEDGCGSRGAIEEGAGGDEGIGGIDDRADDAGMGGIDGATVGATLVVGAGAAGATGGDCRRFIARSTGFSAAGVGCGRCVKRHCSSVSTRALRLAIVASSLFRAVHKR
jgi:hypothetical protein